MNFHAFVTNNAYHKKSLWQESLRNRGGVSHLFKKPRGIIIG